MLVLSMEQQLSALDNNDVYPAHPPANADSSSAGGITPSQYSEKEIQAIFEVNVDPANEQSTRTSRGKLVAFSQLFEHLYPLRLVAGSARAAMHPGPFRVGQLRSEANVGSQAQL